MSKVWLEKQTFEELWALTHNIRLRMQSNIKKAAVNISGSGKRACVNILLPKVAAASSYKGYFKVVDASETDSSGNITYKIKVVDGLDEEAETCGLAVIDDTYFKVATPEAITVEDTSWVYLKGVLNVDDEDNPYVENPTIEVDTEEPEHEDNIGKWLLSRIVFTDKKMGTPSQEHYGPIYGYIHKVCS